MKPWVPCRTKAEMNLVPFNRTTVYGRIRPYCTRLHTQYGRMTDGRTGLARDRHTVRARNRTEPYRIRRISGTVVITSPTAIA